MVSIKGKSDQIFSFCIKDVSKHMLRRRFSVRLLGTGMVCHFEKLLAARHHKCLCSNYLIMHDLLLTSHNGKLYQTFLLFPRSQMVT